jgi:hypothetical protein
MHCKGQAVRVQGALRGEQWLAGGSQQKGGGAQGDLRTGAVIHWAPVLKADAVSTFDVWV